MFAQGKAGIRATAHLTVVIALGPIFRMRKVRLREVIWDLQDVSARGRAGIWGRLLGFEALLLKPWRRGCASPEVDPAPAGPPTSSSLPLCALALDLTFTQLAFASPSLWEFQAPGEGFL